ncbi:MAG TPA: cysteine desulfurase [Trebonia sp.]|jgi:cysteine desulfurase/selenocysteine lyase|nr:cysteine desulfurase [Trebonia sp.]
MSAASPLDVEAIREDFPALSRHVRDDRPLIYLDSGATSQKPVSVLDAEREFYERHNGAAHRGSHLLSEEGTEIYEGARAKVASFIGADSSEIVFTKAATESVNLVAYALTSSIGPGDEILITEIEHHANLVPWQQLARRTGATLKWFKVAPDGRLDVDPSLITERTKIVAVTGQSNVTGVITPLADITRLAHEAGALVLADGAQLVPHHPVDVKALDADFLVFSGHKMLGPLGLGVLYGKYAALEALPPFLFGGDMIEIVRMEGSTFQPPPARFETGVPPAPEAAGLSAAIDYLNGLGMDNVAAHEESLTAHALEAIREIPGVRVLGPDTTEDRGGAVAFEVDGVHPHDVGQVLDELGIAVRTGHHCAWPLHRALGVQASTRATFYVYNTHGEVDALAEGIRYAQKFFGA